jgi:hypothetical protein
VGAVAGLVIGAGGVGAAWAAHGSGSGSGSGSSFTLLGSLELTDAVDVDAEATACQGDGGYDDIAQGASVTVYDAAGTVVATGSLGEGKRATPGDTTTSCVFPVTVLKVPGGSKFYGVEVTHRGKVTVSDADARAGKFAATLG